MKQASIHIDPHFLVGEVDPRLFGSFVEHIGRCVYEGVYQPGHPTADEQGLRGDVMEEVKALKVPVVRYPGGNFVSGYRWEDGVGPKEQRPARPDPAWHTVESNQFGLNEFMDWAAKVDTEAMMTVNLGTRGEEAAWNLLEYCNMPGGTCYSDLRRSHGVEKPYGIKLWCLGNEMDGPWQMCQKTAEEYGNLANRTGQLMKMMDPSIELVACGSSYWAMPTFGEWEDKVLSRCYDVVDYISLHQYYGNTPNDTPEFLAKNNKMDRYIQETLAVCDAVKARLRKNKTIYLSFDEWNVWYHSREHDKSIEPWGQAPHLNEDIYNLEDALLIGSMMITLLRHADRVKVACLAQLVNVIAPIMTSDTGCWRQTIFYPYFYGSNFGRGTVLNTLVDVDTYQYADGDAPYLDAVWVKNDENHMTLFAVNKSLDEDMELSCDLSRFPGFRVAEHKLLTHADVKAENTEENPCNVVPQEGSAAVENGTLKAVLCPKSFHMIRLEK